MSREFITAKVMLGESPVDRLLRFDFHDGSGEFTDISITLSQGMSPHEVRNEILAYFSAPEEVKL